MELSSPLASAIAAAAAAAALLALVRHARARSRDGRSPAPPVFFRRFVPEEARSGPPPTSTPRA